MLRAYKYRIYPTDEQKVMLAKTFGCCRYVYNWALELKKRTYKETGKNISKFNMQTRIRNELRKLAPWLEEVSAKAIESAVFDLYKAYDNFYAGRAGYPKMRDKKGRQSYREGVNGRGDGIKVDFKRGSISIPKIKNIPCVFHRRFNGKIKNACIELIPSGVYRISILVETGKPLPQKAPVDSNKTIGIDTGLKNFIVTSDGLIIKPPREAMIVKRKLKLLQRRLSKKEIGSRQFRILKYRIAKLHEHTANRRLDHIHKLTHYLAYESQATTICVEDLSVKGMIRNKKLAFSAQDAGIGMFYRLLEYKCAWAGKNYVKIDRFAPSSKRCSHCGYIYKKLERNEREWTCPKCGVRHDRDFNAATNIKYYGLSI